MFASRKQLKTEIEGIVKAIIPSKRFLKMLSKKTPEQIAEHITKVTESYVESAIEEKLKDYKKK